MKNFSIPLTLILMCSALFCRAQNVTDADIAKIKEINFTMGDLILKSALGFEGMRGAERQRGTDFVLYDAKEVPGLHAQQYFITDVPLANGLTKSIYMGYYTDANALAILQAAVFAMPAYGGDKWTVQSVTSEKAEELWQEIRLGGVKVGMLKIQVQEKTAVLTLGFMEDPAHAAAEQKKAEPQITAKCESGNCTSGKGELTIYDKQGILTDRLSGEFGGGQFIRGTHFMYGRGATPASVEKDEGTFTDFILTNGTVTLCGYGLSDSVFPTKTYTVAANCISGDCTNGDGKLVTMQPTFGHVQLITKEGKFKDGQFLSGSMFIEGVDTIYDGSYTMRNYKYHPRHNQAWADAVFLPKGSTEEIKGTWGGGSNDNSPIPFYLSDDYHRKEGYFVHELKYKGIPQWILDVYVPITNRRSEEAQQAEAQRTEEALEYDMKIHPNDYKTDENSNSSADGNHNCSCCNGTGSIGSGSFFMGREIPKKCSCCNGTGRVN